MFTVYLGGDDLLRDAGEPDIRNATASSFDPSDAHYFFPDTMQFSGGRTLTLGIQAHC